MIVQDIGKPANKDDLKARAAELNKDEEQGPGQK